MFKTLRSSNIRQGKTFLQLKPGAQMLAKFTVIQGILLQA